MELNDKIIDSVQRHQSDHSLDGYSTIRASLVESPESAESIVVIQPSSIGDVIYTTPALRSLRKKFPRATISYLVETEAAEIIEGNGSVDETIRLRRLHWRYRKPDTRKELTVFLERLRERRFDLVLNPHATARSAWYATLLKRPDNVVLGLSFEMGESPRPVLTGNLYHYRWLGYISPTTVLVPPPNSTSTLIAPAELCMRMGVEPGELKLDLSVSDDERQTAELLLRERGIDPEKGFLTVHTGSNDKRRRYRRDKWPETLEKLYERFGIPIVLIGGAADRDRHGWIRERVFFPCADLAGQGGLKFSAAVIEKSLLLIGMDTSTVHLAAAVGRKSLTITGPRWVGGCSPGNLVLSGDHPEQWCRALEPDQIVEFAGFLLGKNSRPSPPPGFQVSYTGDRYPSIFFRETFPVRERKGTEYLRSALGLGWEKILDEINATWGYPRLGISPEYAKTLIGVPDESAREEYREIRKGFESVKKLLDDLFARVAAGSIPANLLNRYNQMLSSTEGSYLAPLKFHRRLVQGSGNDIDETVHLFRETLESLLQFLDRIFS